ncbi:MAG TPA: M50 family metallopeptidase [Terriglobia bacterium]|nr:M50 family metallopeptidase [Terriglobia bacterium]
MAEVSKPHTPILDRMLPLPPPAQRSSGSWVITTAAICLGVVIGFLAAIGRLPYFPAVDRFLEREFPQLFTGRVDAGGPAALFLALFLGFVGSTAIHEAGHLLAGLLAGFRFSSLRIGPLQFEQPFRVSIHRGGRTGAAGWTRMFPGGSHRLAQKAFLMTAGGPAASLLAAFVVFLLPFPKGYFLFWLSASSLLLGVINLIPFRSGALLSDGWRILMLLQNRERAERWLSLIKLGLEVREGVPPERLSQEFLRKALVVKDNTPDTVTAYAFAYASAFARHDDSKAAEYLETCLQYSAFGSPFMQQALMSDAGVFQARRRGRVDLAEQWLASMPAKTEIPWSRTRVEAAILEAKGDVQGAIRKLEEAERLILAAPNQTLRESAHRSLLRWKSELQPVLSEGADGPPE